MDKTQFLQLAVAVLLSLLRNSSNVRVLCARGIPKTTFQKTTNATMHSVMRL